MANFALIGTISCFREVYWIWAITRSLEIVCLQRITCQNCCRCLCCKMQIAATLPEWIDFFYRCDTFPFNVKYSATNYTCRQNDHFRTPQFSANAVKHQLVFPAFTSWSGKNHDNLIKECSFVTILGQNVFLIIRKLVENQVHCTRISGVYSSNTHLNSQIPLKLAKLRD